MELIRIPSTTNRSLKCWNAADEYLINNEEDISFKDKNVLILGDRFGYLTKNVLLEGGSPIVYIDLKSQKEAINQNCKTFFSFKTGDAVPESDICLVNIPKSISELNLFLYMISQSLNGSGIALFGFMTKHFTKGYITSISRYFDNVTQTKAHKKARLIVAKSIVDNCDITPKVIKLAFNKDKFLTQYHGVFSERNIDYATQYLIKHLSIFETDVDILDLGSGNGIIAFHLYSTNQHNKITLLDNSYRAHLSGKLNINGPNIKHIWDYNLSTFEDSSFDLIVSNPPFHFNFEIDLSIPFQLLQKSASKLRTGGRLVIVANKHINYSSALLDHFSKINIITENNKFYILEAIK